MLNWHILVARTYAFMSRKVDRIKRLSFVTRLSYQKTFLVSVNMYLLRETMLYCNTGLNYDLIGYFA